MNSFAYVQQVSYPLEGKIFETEIMDKNLHRNQWEKVYKLTESLKNVIHILGDAYESVWRRIYSLLSPIEEISMEGLTGVIPEWIYCHIVLIRPVTYWETTQDYILLNGVQNEDSKWEQMIYLWRGLN